MHWQRQFLHPMLKAFDAPSREECVARRTASNTPQAALTLLNDPCVIEAAVAFARQSIRLANRAGEADEQQIDWMWRQSLSRSPLPAERDILMSLLVQNRQYYRQHPAAARQLVAVASDQAETQELAAWTSVARAILNVSELMTRN